MIDWAGLRHAYGSAEDVPGHLAALRSADEEERREAFGELYASIAHQGNRYSASAAAVPALLELVGDPSIPDRDLLLHLLGIIAIGGEGMWLPGTVRVAELRERGLVDELRAYEAVAAGLPVLQRLAAGIGADEDVAVSAAYVLAWFPGDVKSLEILKNRAQTRSGDAAHAAAEEAVPGKVAAGNVAAEEAAVGTAAGEAVAGEAAAVVGVGLLGLSAGIPVAERALGSEDPVLRWAGAVALARLGVGGDRVRDELLGWAAGDAPADPSIPYLEGDLGGYALLSLPLIGVDPLGAALSRLRHVSAEPALTALVVALRAAFPDGGVAKGTTFRALGERQRRVVRVLVDNPAAWLYDGMEFANFSLEVSDRGLPHGRERLQAYAGL
ncbi:hypothetical protein ACQP2X_20475 [Actinoplanes sp. CA-131856]